jgi:hypothetical protein
MYNKCAGRSQPFDRGCENRDNNYISTTDVSSKVQRVSFGHRNDISQRTDLSFIEDIEAEFPFFARLHRIFASIAGPALITANNDSDHSLIARFATPSMSSHPCPSIQANHSFDDVSNSTMPSVSQSITEAFIRIQRYGSVVKMQKVVPYKIFITVQTSRFS